MIIFKLLNKQHLSMLVESLSEPWFSLISLGLKTVEGRLDRGHFKSIQIGDLIQWTNTNFLERTVITRVVAKRNYFSFREYLDTEGLQNCLPGMPSLAHGLSVYYKYYTTADEENYGVVAIELDLVI